MIFRARHFEFVFPGPALVMGIVNVTPDSFFDGGRYLAPDAAVKHALELAAQGADILDVGGDSSRPGTQPAGEAEELARVIPVIKALAAQTKLPISIDTTKPAVARAALAAGASIVNDVAAHRRQDALWRVVAEFHAGYICMHAQGDPAAMPAAASYQNVVAEVGRFFLDHLEQIGFAGVPAEQVVFDPGIGFGKTLEHNLQLLAGLPGLVGLDRPLLLGVSRKSFIGRLLGTPLAERLPASLACASLAIAAGVQLIRVHDVAETVQAVRMTEAVMALRE
jgi:dihydropteroate synthase